MSDVSSIEKEKIHGQQEGRRRNRANLSRASVRAVASVMRGDVRKRDKKKKRKTSMHGLNLHSQPPSTGHISVARVWVDHTQRTHNSQVNADHADTKVVL